jgi:hypothetical protein
MVSATVPRHCLLATDTKLNLFFLLEPFPNELKCLKLCTAAAKGKGAWIPWRHSPNYFLNTVHLLGAQYRHSPLTMHNYCQSIMLPWRRVFAGDLSHPRPLIYLPIMASLTGVPGLSHCWPACYLLLSL